MKRHIWTRIAHDFCSDTSNSFVAKKNNVYQNQHGPRSKDFTHTKDYLVACYQCFVLCCQHQITLITGCFRGLAPI
jgi:hypothetical protein